MKFDGKHCVVTGGASGFGRGIAKAFLAKNAHVTIIDINRDLLEQTRDELAIETSPRISAAFCDITEASQVSDFLAATDRIDIWINNAGVTHLPAPMEDVSESDYDRVMRVNTKAVFVVAKHLVPRMKAQGQGIILNIASTAGISPRPNLTWYNASKGWLITATKSMAAELAPFNIRVNAINPVAGETPLLASFMGSDTEENRNRFLASIPLGRFSTPEDVGETACFLCSEEASMITGVAIEVDGGRCI